MLNRTNTVLAVLLVITASLCALVRVDYSQPNIEILPDMKYTSAWEAFAANSVLPDGRTMQPPVPGTIARGELPLHFVATKEDAIRAGEELENPSTLSVLAAAVEAESEAAASGGKSGPAAPSADTTPKGEDPNAEDAARQAEAARRAAVAGQRFAASIERGAHVYRTFCVSCHGAKGIGDGPVTQRGFPPPPSLLTGKSRQMKDGQLFHILTYGQGSMAPFAGQVTRARRWDVINYVRDLQSHAPAPPIDSPEADNQPPSTGEAAAPTTESPQTDAVDPARSAGAKSP